MHYTSKKRELKVNDVVGRGANLFTKLSNCNNQT